MTQYLKGLTDESLVVRPVEGAHHAAWQLGHLIVSERRMVEGVRKGSGVALPAVFEAAHDKDPSYSRNVGFLPLAEYVDLMTRQRELTLGLLREFPEADLALPAPEFMRAYAPTNASVFLSIASHELMHAGQIAVIRRRLGLPVVV
jgi:hypothetical protein